MLTTNLPADKQAILLAQYKIKLTILNKIKLDIENKQKLIVERVKQGAGGRAALKVIVGIIASIIFSSGGFFTGQSVVLWITGLSLNAAMASPTILAAVLVAGVLCAVASVASYWFLERLGMYDLVDKMAGIPRKTVKAFTKTNLDDVSQTTKETFMIAERVLQAPQRTLLPSGGTVNVEKLVKDLPENAVQVGATIAVDKPDPATKPNLVVPHAKPSIQGSPERAEGAVPKKHSELQSAEGTTSLIEGGPRKQLTFKDNSGTSEVPPPPTNAPGKVPFYSE